MILKPLVARSVQTAYRIVVSFVLALVVLPATLAVPYASQVSLVYSTDFEKVTKLDAHRLDMGGIPDWFVFENASGGYGDTGASMWMEGLDRHTPGITCHSGSRCVGMELTDITKSRRNQFDIDGVQSLVGDEIFVSVWLYLPADWGLHAPSNTINIDWYELVNPFFTDAPSYLPYAAVHIHQPDTTKSIFVLKLDIRNDNSYINYGTIDNYALPRGRWFNVQYYVYRNPTNGIVKVWIGGKMVFDLENTPTKDPSNPRWFVSVAKIYYDTSDTFSPYRIWVDDLQMYNTQPLLPQRR